MADPKPEAPKKAPRFVHPDRPIVVLVPFDQKEQRLVNEQLGEEFATLERIPKVSSDLRVGRLPTNSVLYVAHPYSTRDKVGNTFQWAEKVHVSEPLEIKHFTQDGLDGDDFTAGVNVPQLVDAITNACKRENIKGASARDSVGRFFRAQLSGEKEETLRTVKLLNQ